MSAENAALQDESPDGRAEETDTQADAGGGARAIWLWAPGQSEAWTLELLQDDLALPVVGELVHPEELAVVEGGQAVDVDLPGLGEGTSGEPCGPRAPSPSPGGANRPAAAGQSATGHGGQNRSLPTPLNSDKLRAGPAGLLGRTRETRAFRPPRPTTPVPCPPSPSREPRSCPAEPRSGYADRSPARPPAASG